MRIKSLGFLALAVICLANEPLLAATTEKTKDDRVVKDGMLVALDFTLKSPDGKVIETSKGKEPLKYIHGKKMMIPGLEKELTGMKVGAEKHVTVKPEDGYGKIDPKAVQEIPKEKIPANALKVGAVLAAKSPEGMIVPMTVREIKDKTVVMDLNHPMAGKTLVFDIKVVDIQPAPPPPSLPSTPAAPAKPSAPAQPAKPAEPAQKK
jgi:FKBP-type peptidyl-prolyl cis-trans isomerase SlyD